MTNILRSVAALITPIAILACTLLSACAPTTTTLRGAMTGPTLVAAALTEVACEAKAERETDLWWECVVATESARCAVEGWCE